MSKPNVGHALRGRGSAAARDYPPCRWCGGAIIELDCDDRGEPDYGCLWCGRSPEPSPPHVEPDDRPVRARWGRGFVGVRVG